MNVPKRKPKYWGSPVPEFDDFNQLIDDIFINGKTIVSSWAIMTPKSFQRYGVGLGTDSGQRYSKQADGQWLKVEG